MLHLLLRSVPISRNGRWKFDLVCQKAEAHCPSVLLENKPKSHWRRICCSCSTWFLCSGGKRLICSGVRLMTCWSSAFSISGVSCKIEVKLRVILMKIQVMSKSTNPNLNSNRDSTDGGRAGWLPGPICPGTSDCGAESCVNDGFSCGADAQEDPLSTCMELPAWVLNSVPNGIPPDWEKNIMNRHKRIHSRDRNNWQRKQAQQTNKNWTSLLVARSTSERGF